MSSEQAEAVGMLWLGIGIGWVLGFLAAMVFQAAVRRWAAEHPELYDDVLEEAEARAGEPREAGARTAS